MVLLNGDNRSNMLKTMSLIVSVIVVTTTYLYYYETRQGNYDAADRILDYLENIGLLLIGMFIAVGRALFNIDQNKSIVLLNNVDGTIQQLEVK